MHENTDLFEQQPVWKAILMLAVPTVLAQLITVIYNMADTFFIGQLNDPNQVAAATIAMPFFVFLTAIANLLGIGGSSFISRALGAGQGEKARNASSFCIYVSAIAAFIYGIFLVLTAPWVLRALGANDGDYLFTFQYVLWTIGIGAVPTVLNACMAHLIRSEGYSFQASFGIALGGIMNMVLDPIFIYGLHTGIAGAAAATMLSNVIACLYFFWYLWKIRDHTCIHASIRNFKLPAQSALEILSVGLPSFVMTLMGTISNAVMNTLTASFSNEAVAGMGIAKKIDMVAYSVGQGMTQGPLPFIGYNYAHKNYQRMKAGIWTTMAYALSLAVTGMTCLELFAVPVVHCFISNAETVRFGQTFLKVIALACPSTALNYLFITIFQAAGKEVQPLILSLLRKGGLDIPLMFLFTHLYGIIGIAWATPCADWMALGISLILFIPFLKKLNAAIHEVQA